MKQLFCLIIYTIVKVMRSFWTLLGATLANIFFMCHYCLALKKKAQKSQPKLLEKSCRLYFCAF